MLIRAANLSDNKVHEDQRWEQDHSQPKDPEHNMLLVVQIQLRVVMLRKQIESEVSQSQPHNIQEISPEFGNIPILRRLIGRDNVENHWQKEGHDEKEEQKHPDVGHNLQNHGNDVAELLDHLKELKHLVKGHEHL